VVDAVRAGGGGDPDGIFGLFYCSLHFR
jgi:hypothetical protein